MTAFIKSYCRTLARIVVRLPALKYKVFGVLSSAFVCLVYVLQRSWPCIGYIRQ